MRETVEHRRHDDGGSANDDKRYGHQNPAAFGSRTDDDGRAKHKKHQAGTQVWLEKDQAEGHEENRAEPHVVAKRLDLAVVLGHDRRHEENDDDLAGLRGLEPKADQGNLDPAGHSLCSDAQTRNLWHQDEKDRDAK